MEAILEYLKNEVRSEVSEKSFTLWVNPLTLIKQEDNTLFLGCPNKFSKNWIMDNYADIFTKKLQTSGYSDLRLEFSVIPMEKKISTPDTCYQSNQLSFSYSSKNDRNLGRLLNSEFTFDRFVVGKSNEFAYSISKALALGDSFPYDSLFLKSNTGLGKSHLSQAIGNTILEQNPACKICYITTEDFINEMIFALKNHHIETFKDKYRRTCDVLLLEEIHFLGGKRKTQIELGHTLDILSNGRKKIIFTSSLLPKDIPDMSKELSSRLTSGIITTIEKPDYDTRIKILEKKAIEKNLTLSEDIIHLLATHLTRDVRQLESTLCCLKAKSELLKAKITPEIVKEEIRCRVSEQKTTSLQDIQRLVCQYYKVDPSMLKSKSRKKIYAYPRKIYVYLCRYYTDETLENIGKSIARNHSTVLYAAELIEKKMKTDTKIKGQVDLLRKKIEETMK